MRKSRLFLAPLLVISSFVVSPAAFAQAPEPDANPYLRFVENPDGSARLEASIVRLRDAGGREVALVSAVHVGDAAYYKALSREFATQDRVLYELVAPEGTIPQAGQNNRGAVSGVQHMLKTMLGLTFQLDQVDYAAKNFVHADLTADVFERMQAERGESLMGLMLQSMLDEMMNPTVRPGDPPPEVQSAMFLAALMAGPDRPRQLKLILGRQFGDIDTKIANLTGPDGSVLLTERNKAAIGVLKDQLSAGRKRVAIFYGAAHMRDMQRRVEAMGFKPVASEWLTAWDVPKPPATTQPAP